MSPLYCSLSESADDAVDATCRLITELSASHTTTTVFILCVRDGTAATLNGQLSACAPRMPTGADTPRMRKLRKLAI
jgi:hypothetical protein